LSYADKYSKDGKGNTKRSDHAEPLQCRNIRQVFSFIKKALTSFEKML